MRWETGWSPSGGGDLRGVTAAFDDKAGLRAEAGLLPVAPADFRGVAGLRLAAFFSTGELFRARFLDAGGILAVAVFVLTGKNNGGPKVEYSRV